MMKLTVGPSTLTMFILLAAHTNRMPAKVIAPDTTDAIAIRFWRRGSAFWWWR
jgi:hypothetical protein